MEWRGGGGGGPVKGGARGSRNHDSFQATTSAHQHALENVPWEDLVGRVSTLAADQHGCRLLQRKIDEKGTEAVAGIMLELKGHLPNLMTGEQ